MKAFAIDAYGGPLTLHELPEPAVGLEDVLIDVHAAGLNPLDERIRHGALKRFAPASFPLVLGNDLAGTVIASGANVRNFKVGDEVYAKTSSARVGTLVERIAVQEGNVALKPATATMSEAASLPLVGLTAWQALVERARVKAGDKVFIDAGAGGVGTIAIQLAKYLGASVATTSSSRNRKLVSSLGADQVIDYRTQDFDKLLDGYDLVLASLGPDELRRSVSVLRPGGMLITLSGPPDPAFVNNLPIPWLARQLLGLKSRKIRHLAGAKAVDYSFLFMRPSGAQLANLAKLVDAGSIKPIVAETWEFAQTPAAFDRLGQSKTAGKIVVEIKR